MKTKIIVVASVLAIAAGGFYVYGLRTAPGHMPADLRDAVADNGGFDTSIPQIDKSNADTPEPSPRKVNGAPMEVMTGAKSAWSANQGKAGLFQGNSAWSGTSDYTSLERLGVRKAAEEDAVVQCQAQGQSGCFAVASILGECGYGSCKASATARLLIPVPGGKVYTGGWGGSSTSLGNTWNSLEQLGLRKEAEEYAVAKCLSAGEFGCVATASKINKCDDYDCHAIGYARAMQPAKQ